MYHSADPAGSHADPRPSEAVLAESPTRFARFCYSHIADPAGSHADPRPREALFWSRALHGLHVFAIANEISGRTDPSGSYTGSFVFSWKP